MERPRAAAPLWPDLPGGLGLVSTSPRRAELLRAAGVPFRVIPPAEGSEGGGGDGKGGKEDPERLAALHAEAKARSVPEASAGILLAADTVVVSPGGRILGKPADGEEAAAMLRLLSGAEHRVVTAVFALRPSDGRCAGGAEGTAVHFRDLSEEEIGAYVATGEPMDKAGAYGIQGIGGLLVSGIRGCYFNVVGLPLARTREILRAVLEA
ncbi:MAG: Maf family protein [Candidatus Eisenbacteria bacterium]